MSPKGKVLVSPKKPWCLIAVLRTATPLLRALLHCMQELSLAGVRASSKAGEGGLG